MCSVYNSETALDQFYKRLKDDFQSVLRTLESLFTFFVLAILDAKLYVSFFLISLDGTTS